MECHLLWVRLILTKENCDCIILWVQLEGLWKRINCMSDPHFGCEWKFRIMSDVEISLPFSKFANQNKLTGANNNNNNSATKHKACNSELELRRSASPRIVISKNLVLMSPESNARHSPNQNNRNSLSPATSVSPRTMSPSPEQRISISSYSSDGYQPNYVNPLQSYQTTAMPPKKSFCIDALLSKNNQNGDHSPDANRFSNDEDAAHKYHDDQREYASSPDDGNSRWVKVPNPCRRLQEKYKQNPIADGNLKWNVFWNRIRSLFPCSRSESPSSQRSSPPISPGCEDQMHDMHDPFKKPLPPMRPQEFPPFYSSYPYHLMQHGSSAFHRPIDATGKPIPVSVNRARGNNEIINHRF